MGAAGTGVGTLGQTAASTMATTTNARILSQEANAAEYDAQQQEIQNRRQWSLERGKANAGVAAGGVSLSSGSPLLMELDRAKQSEIEALSIRRAGKMRAQGLNFNARMERKSRAWKIFGGSATASGQFADAAKVGGSGG